MPIQASESEPLWLARNNAGKKRRVHAAIARQSGAGAESQINWLIAATHGGPLDRGSKPKLLSHPPQTCSATWPCHGLIIHHHLSPSMHKRLYFSRSFAILDAINAQREQISSIPPSLFTSVVGGTCVISAKDVKASSVEEGASYPSQQTCTPRSPIVHGPTLHNVRP